MIVTYIGRAEVNRLKSNQVLWILAIQTYVRPKGTGPKNYFPDNTYIRFYFKGTIAHSILSL